MDGYVTGLASLFSTVARGIDEDQAASETQNLIEDDPQCVCFKLVGDNVDCPVHGGGNVATN